MEVLGTLKELKDDVKALRNEMKNVRGASTGTSTVPTVLLPVPEGIKRQLQLAIRNMILHGACMGGYHALHRFDPVGRWFAVSKSVLDWMKQENPTLMRSVLPNGGSMGLAPMGGGRDVSFD